MFWKFSLLTTSHIDTLLEKEDVTLKELMDEDDILQECKAQNMKLIDFIIRPEHMEEMVNLITIEPVDSDDEKLRYKYPNTACELLTSDVSQINDALAGSEELIKKLYNFLETDQPLNPLLASFFSKVMGLLITRKSEMIFEFLKAKEDFVGTLLHHIGTSAIMDLLLRLLTCVEWVDLRRAVIEWLNEKQIVEKLVSCLDPSQDEDIHCNAAQSLCDIVRLGREQLSQLQDKSETDPLLTTVELEETVSDLLSNMLDKEKNESVIVNGLSVIQTLLEFRKQGPEGSNEQISSLDTERLAHGVSNVLLAITPRLKDFHSLLKEPPKQRYCSMPTSIGTLDPPLGNTRLQIARLLSALVLTNTHTVNVELANLNTIGVLIDLYFQYVWNNFLHTHVSQCLNTILFNSPVEADGRKEHPLLVQIFSESSIVQRILDEWEENDQQQSRDKGRRRGYMGHLTKMANDIVTVLEKGENSELVKEQISELKEEYKEKWEKFTSSTLSDINKQNTVELVRGHPLASSSEDEDHDFRDIPFPQDAAMQQAFSDYQLQQMTSNFIDQFGFNEEEFVEQEEKSDSPFTERISSIDFNVQASDESQANAASMFEQACNERIQQFDDNDSDEDIWEEKEITFSTSTQQKRATRLPETREDFSDDSTDSEEELDSPRRIVSQPNEKMDVDHTEAWVANFDNASSDSTQVAMDTSPWSTSTSATSSQPANDEPTEKWADFTNKIPNTQSEENWADFSNITDLSSSDPGPRSSSPVAMDVTETGSRPAAYLAQSAPADLGSVVEQSNANDLKAEDIEDVESSTDLVQEAKITSSSDSGVKVSQPDQSDSALSSESTSNTQSPQKTSSADLEEPSSSTPEVATAEQEDSASPLPSVSDSSIPQNPAKSISADSGVEDAQCSSSESQVVHSQSEGFIEKAAEDLTANFDFLTGSGLMKSTKSTEVPSEEAKVESNGPVPKSSEEEDDDIKTQAKESVEKKDNVLNSETPTLQNGPV